VNHRYRLYCCTRRERFGHSGAFGTEGWIDAKNDLIRIMLVQLADGTADAPRSVVMQIGEAAVE